MKPNTDYLFFSYDHCPDAAAKKYKRKYGKWPRVQFKKIHWIVGPKGVANANPR